MLGRVSFASFMEEAGVLEYSVQQIAIGEPPRRRSQERRDVVVYMEAAFDWTRTGTTAASSIRKLFSLRDSVGRFAADQPTEGRAWNGSRD
jgi:hypothetical protein